MTSSTTIGSNGTTVSPLMNDTMSNNSSTNSTNSATGSTSSSSSSSASNTTGAGLQSTFLQLLVTQLQNQDPTNPMDSSQMTSQLAEINTVTGISQLNTSLSSLSTQLNAGQTSQAALLIGQKVLAPGNSLSITSGTETSFGVQLGAAASDMQVNVVNSAGQIVNTIDLGAQPAGVVPVSWEPVDSSGNPLPTGTYTITATGTVNGVAGTGTTLTTATVESVVQGTNGAPSLALSTGSTVPLTSVAAVL
ncbi:flagellar hook assembly protein FlgD [Paraburkholderia sp. DHOC27]|uniref:flagellar hook assembly protein FlgD n=1 Tax=Paraburkholderia sp. DHOC27 TaxID=2303330 RepID=UPI000E3B80C6|nr:flagellar hook assembly protein FlgD [Paraburkholderia sp. DHOC27]RFU47504.1 flagellar hook assembly protein FlgD [Paraburkholderia sp. DHOC27]